jgi:hypothetical protein
MRYLLENDNDTLKRLCKLKDNYFDYRQPNKLIENQIARIRWHKKDLLCDISAFNMTSEKQINVEEYIHKNIKNERDDLVLNTFKIQYDIEPDYYRITADYYYASPTYLKVLNSIKYFDKLKLKAHSWLLPLAKMDVRNLVIQNGYLMLGKRGRNEFDAYLLGDFISFTKLMTIEEYDKQLKLFKDEI